MRYLQWVNVGGSWTVVDRAPKGRMRERVEIR